MLALWAVQPKGLYVDLIGCGKTKPVRNWFKIYVLYNDRNIIAGPGTGHSEAAWFKANNFYYDLPTR